MEQPEQKVVVELTRAEAEALAAATPITALPAYDERLLVWRSGRNKLAAAFLSHEGQEADRG